MRVILRDAWYQSIPPILRPSDFTPGHLRDSVLLATRQNHNKLQSLNSFPVRHSV